VGQTGEVRMNNNELRCMRVFDLMMMIVVYATECMQ
jgi:hypothetical protein